VNGKGFLQSDLRIITETQMNANHPLVFTFVSLIKTFKKNKIQEMQKFFHQKVTNPEQGLAIK
jgi:hypothetical protein